MSENYVNIIKSNGILRFKVTEQGAAGGNVVEKKFLDEELLTLEFSGDDEGKNFAITAEGGSGRGSGTVTQKGNLILLDGQFDSGNAHIHEIMGVIYPTRAGEMVNGQSVSESLFIDFQAYIGEGFHADHGSPFAHTHPIP